MKKIKKLLTIGFAVLLMLCMSSCTPMAFLNRELKKFPVECNKYGLDSARRVNENDILDCIDYEIEPIWNEEFNDNGIRIKEQEIYNQNDLRIIRKEQEDKYGNSLEFIIYEKEKTWYLNQEFMEQSKTFVSYSNIWKKWNKDIADYPNVIVGLCISREEEIFITTSSTKVAMMMTGKYPLTLWYFDREQGKILYCDYLKQDDGNPCVTGMDDVVIVKK